MSLQHLPPLVFYRAVAFHSDVHREGENVLRRTTLLVKGGLVPRPSRVSTGHLSECSRTSQWNVLETFFEMVGRSPHTPHVYMRLPLSVRHKQILM